MLCRNGIARLAPSPASPRAVFLSYASQDAEAARRIRETLRAVGVEVSLDADGGLEHGDEWDAKIRRQIKDCVLFIPLISANTQARIDFPVAPSASEWRFDRVRAIYSLALAATARTATVTDQHTRPRTADEIVSNFSKTVLDCQKTRPLPCSVTARTHVHHMIIKAYLKPHCGWSNGVRAILRKHSLPFEDIDIINDRSNYAEMVQKSGQPLSPCVEVDGVMLADVSGEEVENYLLSNDLVKPTDAPTGVATNAGCSDEEHAKMATKTIRFF